MSKVLVTGGAGFIGSHLCHRFISEGHHVICVDNFISGSKDNIADLLENDRFELIEHDIINPLPSSSSFTNLESIFHFACPASPNPNSPVSYMNHPLETLMVSSLGSKNMLDLAVKNNCQIILASTSEVYGDPAVHPQPETYWGNVSSTGIRSCYDEGKRFMEALAFTYYRQLKTKIKVIRIFNTYGPHMRLDDGRFTINLIDSYLNKKSFKMYGEGNSTRSFCYIDDLVDAIAKVFASESSIGEVINLGNPNEFTLNEAVKVFETIVGQTLTKEYLAASEDDPKKRQPDISKAKKILGWEPQVSFADGMKKTLNYYEQQLKVAN